MDGVGYVMQLCKFARIIAFKNNTCEGVVVGLLRGKQGSSDEGLKLSTARVRCNCILKNSRKNGNEALHRAVHEWE